VLSNATLSWEGLGGTICHYRIKGRQHVGKGGGVHIRLAREKRKPMLKGPRGGLGAEKARDCIHQSRGEGNSAEQGAASSARYNASESTTAGKGRERRQSGKKILIKLENCRGAGKGTAQKERNPNSERIAKNTT